MPTYSYRCEHCGHELEVFQKMSDNKLTECPKCAKLTLVRLINASGGFQLKGKGWFKDGY